MCGKGFGVQRCVVTGLTFLVAGLRMVEFMIMVVGLRTAELMIRAIFALMGVRALMAANALMAELTFRFFCLLLADFVPLAVCAL